MVELKIEELEVPDSHQDIKIHKNVTIPEQGKKPRRTKYPFASMKVKDCFVVPKKVSKHQISSAMYAFQKRKTPKVDLVLIEVGRKRIVWRRA